MNHESLASPRVLASHSNRDFDFERTRQLPQTFQTYYFSQDKTSVTVVRTICSVRLFEISKYICCGERDPSVQLTP